MRSKDVFSDEGQIVISSRTFEVKKGMSQKDCVIFLSGAEKVLLPACWCHTIGVYKLLNLQNSLTINESRIVYTVGMLDRAVMKLPSAGI